MKYLLLFVAIVGFAAADDLSVLKDFLSCCHRAIEYGVPSIPIPVHEPLVISNVTYSFGLYEIYYKISLTNNILHNLLNYTFPVLNASSYHNPEGVAFGYDIYWPKLNFTGEWEIEEKHPSFNIDIKGTYNIVLNEVDWWGIFNLTKPGQEAQGYNNTVNAFSLESSTSSVDAILTGVEDEGTYEEFLEMVLMFVMNNFSGGEAEYLRTQRFNDFWIGHPQRIRDLLDWCGYN